MAAVRRTKLLETSWRLHRWLFRVTGGRVGTRFQGMPIVMLTTTGRRSGEPRSVTIPFIADGDAYVCVGSNAGHPADPDWVRNLRADPRATLFRKGERFAVTGHEAEGDERERLWAMAVETDPAYAEYERRVTSRRIPVMVLERSD
jgi:deazaflavin-dependent oxidoreductase (nitroreductase family)